MAVSERDDPYEDNECWNCGGEGYVYGCSWDWQCDTYDAGEGTCLCTRRCHICYPPKPDPELQAVLANALRSTDTPQ
jgi:trehalose utilization protein